MRPSSSSSTEEPALRIDGFRVEREIRRTTTAVTYEAVQVDLERRVVLTVLGLDDPRAQRFQAVAWPEHRHVVSLLAAGRSEHGFYVATRWVPGATTLAERIAAGDDVTRWLAGVREALESAGVVHGALDEDESLLIDGDDQVLITGLGLGPPSATAADDERALAALERMAAMRSHRRRIPSGRRRRRARAAVAAAMAAGVTLVLIAVVTNDDEKPPDPAPPPVARGMVALGSALAAGPESTVGCERGAPSSESQGCTAMQIALPGRTLVAPRDGAIRRWHVRGAHGELALRVIRRRGGNFFVVGGSDFERVDGGLRSFDVDVPIRTGDLIGLELAPGSSGGFRGNVRGASTTRFTSVLRSGPRAPNPPPGIGRGEEILLRVDYQPGRFPGRVTGAAAAGAPAGRRVAERQLDLPDGRGVTVAVVALADRVVLDVFRGTRRRARIGVPGADPDGQLVALSLINENHRALVWRNPDGSRIEARFQVSATSIELIV